MRLIRMLVLVPALIAAACDVGGLEEIDLAGDMTASPLNATVGQEVTVTIEAEGTRLLSFLIDYDDGSDQDFLSIAGAREARWTRVHTFAAAGTYEIVGRIDEIADTLTRVVTVTITDAGAGGRAAPSPFVELPR
jgi:hypothetical protein